MSVLLILIEGAFRATGEESTPSKEYRAFARKIQFTPSLYKSDEGRIAYHLCRLVATGNSPELTRRRRKCYGGYLHVDVEPGPGVGDGRWYRDRVAGSRAGTCQNAAEGVCGDRRGPYHVDDAPAQGRECWTVDGYIVVHKR